MASSTATIETTTSPLAARLTSRVLVIPIGATEQHGPHLPLSTDTDIATRLAHRLSDAVPGDVVLAPAVPFGASGEHQDFAGTLSIGETAVELLLVELGRSATRTWPRVLYLSTHGGNMAAVTRAVARLRAEGRDVRAWWPTWDGDAHAGHTETSIMLEAAADRVHSHALPEGAREPLTELLPRLRRDGVAAVSPNGVLGDARTANPAAGAAYLDQATAALVRVIRTWPVEHQRA